MNFRLPAVDEQTAIIGQNGSGKTMLGGWLLAQQDFKSRPWVIVDYKGEQMLNSISRARVINNWRVPDIPGLFIVHPRPDHVEEMERFLFDIWERGNIGLYIDEGYMLPKKAAFRALLTQGRSKSIPIITLSQRPIEIDRFVFSEASHVAVFNLTDRRDIKTVSWFTPDGFVNWVPPEFGSELPRFHARWFNVKDRTRFVLRPVPMADVIVNAINNKLDPQRRFI